MRVRKLGLIEYAQSWQAMQDFTNERGPDTEDELWLVQHPPVFTQGQAGKAEHVLVPGDIPVVQSDRGGQVTYHGPGQWLVYLLLDLRRNDLGVRDLVDLIEHSIVAVLGGLGISAQPRRDAPGVYVDAAKIASLGLRVRRGCSYHGLALNVDMELEPFSRINPCGFQGLEVTTIRRCLGPQGWQELTDQAQSRSLEDAAELVAQDLLAEIARRLPAFSE
jgi:lipoyl(octanoyl) transferase